MGKRKKNVIFYILIILSITVAVGFMWWMVSSLSPPDKNKADKYFNRDKADIRLITEYLIDSDYPVMCIKNANGYMHVAGFDIKIDDSAVMEAIRRLFEQQEYKQIDKFGNTISFQIWERFIVDFASGIAYSINGKDEPEMQFLTKIEPLSEDGWYYFEADYNEWRVR